MTFTEAKDRYFERVTDNFALWEFIYSSTAEQLGIDNTPPDWVVDNIYRLARGVLQPLRECYGKSIAIAGKGGSGYRCKDLNDAVGGSKTSAHLYGLAADCHVAEPVALARALVKSGLVYDQCILYPTFVHIGIRIATSDNRKQVLYNKSYRGENINRSVFCSDGGEIIL